MTRNYGFTLAEVLITLGIIGVVAAMTMPTLINQTNGAQYKAAYKKALSAISQGVTLNVALDDISFADTIPGEKGKTTAGNGKAANEGGTTGTTIASLLASRMNVVKASEAPTGYSPVMSVVKVCKADKPDCTEESDKEDKSISTSDYDTYLFFNDSSMFAFNSSDNGCTKQYADGSAGTNKICTGFIDVNGLKGPNKEVTCDESGTALAKDGACTVKSPTDIYPVQFYDQTILPATTAAEAVLYGK